MGENSVMLNNRKTIEQNLKAAEETFEEYIGDRIRFLKIIISDYKNATKIDEKINELVDRISKEIAQFNNRNKITEKNIYSLLNNKNVQDNETCDMFLHDFSALIDMLAEFIKYETAHYFIGGDYIKNTCAHTDKDKIERVLKDIFKLFSNALRFLNKNSTDNVEHFFELEKRDKNVFLIISRIRVISYSLRVYLKYVQLKMNPRYSISIDEYDYILNDCNKILNILERDFYEFSEVQYGPEEEYKDLLQQEDIMRVCYASIVANLIKGYVYYNLSNNARAEDAFSKAVDLSKKIFEVLIDKNPEAKHEKIRFDIAKAKLVLGKIFLDKGNFFDALCLYLESLYDFLKIFEENKEINTLRININTILNKEKIIVKKNNDIIDKKIVRNILNEIQIEKLNLLSNNSQPLVKKWARKYIADLLSRTGYVFYIILGAKEQQLIEKWYNTAIKLSGDNLLAFQNLAVIQGKINKDDLIKVLSSNQPEPSRKLTLFTLYSLNVAINVPSESLEACILRSMLTNLENIVTVPQKFNKRILIEKKVGKGHHKNINKFLCLRRWNSFTPAIPRPVDFNKWAGGVHSYNSNQCPGGGYFLIWNNKGIVIDPGFDFIRNLYSAGYSVADIDAIVLTHAHIDHMGDFFTLLTLIYERQDLLKRLYGENNSGFEKIDLFLNIGAMNSFLSWFASQTKDTIRHIHTLPRESAIEKKENYFLDLSGPEYNMKIEVTKAAHNEIYAEDWAVGIKFYLPIVGRNKPVVLGITSDTAFKEEIIMQYGKCDILATHLGDINYKEVVSFANIGGLLEDKSTTERIVDGISGEANISHLKELAVSLGVADQESCEQEGKKLSGLSDPKEIVRRILHKEEVYQLKNHLGFKGALELAKRIDDQSKDEEKIIIFTEFPEYLGSFRKRIAAHFNEQSSLNKIKYFTGDLGLQIRINQQPNDDEQLFFIQCNKCARDNEVGEDKSFHAIENCQETCVKSADETIVYYCNTHRIKPEKYFINKITQ